MEYSYFDSVWLALDADCHVAAFITAGAGPIPEAYLRLDEEVFHSLEEQLLELLPVRGVGIPPHGSLDSVGALVSRGLFVYDWSDVHRTSAAKRHCYELLSSPSSPIVTSDIPAELQDVVWAVDLSGVRFRDSPLLDPRPHVPCMDRPA